MWASRRCGSSMKSHKIERRTIFGLAVRCQKDVRPPAMQDLRFMEPTSCADEITITALIQSDTGAMFHLAAGRKKIACVLFLTVYA